ncbi:MAG: TonB-dependent receptor [Sandaracinaceae bacterium]
MPTPPPVDGGAPPDAPRPPPCVGDACGEPAPPEPPGEDAPAGPPAEETPSEPTPSDPPPSEEEPQDDERAAERDAEPPVHEPSDVDPGEDGADHAHTHAHTHTHAHDHEDEDGELGVTAVIEAPHPRDPAPAAASTLDIEPGILRDVPRRSADEMLTLAPGVLTANHNGVGHAPTLFLRGFNAGEGQDVEMMVDGIPINEPSNAHGHGYADPRFVIPELMRSVRVMQGPFDPRQGDFAVAGSIDYRLGLPRGILARGEYGSYDERRLVLAWGPEDAEEGTFVGAELRDGAGFGPNRAHFGAAVLGRYEHRFERGLRAFVLGAVQSAQFDSAGVVREDDVSAGRLTCGDTEAFFCVADPNQGGSASRYLVALGLRYERPIERVEVTLWGNLRQLRIREDFTGQYLDPQGDGLDERYETGTAGLRANYRVRIPWDGRDHYVEVGAMARHDAGDTSSLRIRRERAIPYATLFDSSIHITDIGAWAVGELAIQSWLFVQAGLRVDALQYSVTDHGLPTSDRDGDRLPVMSADAFGLSVQPRGTVRVTLVSENEGAQALHWITSAGVGTRSSDATALSEGERSPFARAIALESGLQLGLEEERKYDFDANAGVFHTYVDDELIFDATRGRNVSAGASNRYGAYAYARFRFERWLDASLSVAWTEANLSPSARYFDLTAGDRVPYVPRVMGRADVAGRERFRLFGEPFGAGAAAGVTWLGPRPLPNGAEGDAYAVVDASAHVSWRFVELGVMAQNLFDARYQRALFSYVSRFDLDRAASMTPATHYAAGAPFMFFVTLTLHLTPLAWLRGEPDTEEP